jgi:hypothetical protein
MRALLVVVGSDANDQNLLHRRPFIMRLPVLDRLIRDCQDCLWVADITDGIGCRAIPGATRSLDLLGWHDGRE